MSNALYDAGRQAFATGAINWTSATIKAALVHTASYSVNLSTDANLSDIPGGAIVATSASLASLTATAGAVSAANLTFSAVSGAVVNAIVLYKDTGTSTTSTLIAYLDTATGLPITPNGGDIVIVWDTGVNKIFRV